MESEGVMTELTEMKELMKRVNQMNLFIIDDEYRIKHLETYGTALDDKYVYRNLVGDHVYSIDYLLNSRTGYELSFDDELPTRLEGSQ